MKNLVYLSVVAMVAGLAACASDNARNFHYEEDESCSDALIKPAPAPAPRPAPCVQCQQAPVALQQDCGGCPAREYTVRTPVQVVYKNTTYRTVYEPRTFESSSFETRPYNRAEVCDGGNCFGAPVSQPALPQPAVAQPTVIQPAQY